MIRCLFKGEKEGLRQLLLMENSTCLSINSHRPGHIGAAVPFSPFPGMFSNIFVVSALVFATVHSRGHRLEFCGLEAEFHHNEYICCKIEHGDMKLNIGTYLECYYKIISCG